MAHLVMFVYTAFYIGRIHELFGFLRPLRIMLLLGLLGVVLTLARSPRRRNRILQQPEVWIVLGMTLIAVLFAPFSVWPGGSWSFLLDSFTRVLVFFFLIVALATSPRIIQSLVWSVMAGVTLLGIFTISGASADVYGGRAYASSTYDPNEVAMMMVCTLPLAAFGAIALRGVRRVIALGTACVCILVTIVTMSRGGFIGLLFVSIMLLFRLGKASLALRVVVLLIVVVFLAAAAPAKYWDLMETIWNPTVGGEYTESGVFSRVALWAWGLHLFIRQPVTGVGVGMYEVAEGLSHGGRGKWSTAHNSFIQLATELGVGGIALFVALLVRSIRNARRAVRSAIGDPSRHDLLWIAIAVETSLYAYIVEGFALSQAYSPMLYFLVGVAVALRLQSTRAAAAPAPAGPQPVVLRPQTASR